MKKHKQFHYKNGATLIYRHANEKNVTAICAGFLCGFKYEEGGLAHFAEHCICEKTQTKTREEVFTERSLMEDFNFMTGLYFLAGHAFQSNRKENLVYEIVSQALFDYNIDQEVVEKHKKIISQERATVLRDIKKDSNLSNRHYWFMTNLFQNVNQYVDCSIGTQEFLDNVTAEDVLAFLDRHFYSDKFIISVVSNRPFFKVKKLVEKYFISRLRVPSTPSVILQDYQNFDQNDKMQVEPDPTSEMLRVVVSICFHPTSPKTYPLIKETKLLAEGLVEKTDSFRDKVRNSGLVYLSPSVSFMSNEDNKDACMKISFSASSYENIEKIFSVLGDSILDLKNGFITEDDIKKYKDGYQMMLDRKITHKKSAPTHAYSNFSRQITYGDKWPHFTRRQNRQAIKNLTLDMVRDFINLVLNKDNNVIISFAGNVTKDQVKDVSFYKNLIFKNES